MKTRALIPVLVSMLSLGTAHAQDTGSDELTLRPNITCYKLTQAGSSCVVVGPTVVNYEHPRFNVVDMNGAWADAADVTPYIYFYADAQYAGGYTIRVDLSLVNRPDGFGYMVDENTIAIVFPDDRDYTGKIENNGRTIRWSNNTVWTKR